MAYCVKCGEKVSDTAVTCPACGAVIPGEKPGQGSAAEGYAYGKAGTQGYERNTYYTYDNGQTREGYFPESEIRSSKAMAVLCYIGILVFIPVFAGDKQSEYLKLHKNQGLTLFIIEAFLNVLERYRGWSAGIFAWFTGGIVDVGIDIVRFAVLILFVIGIVYACRGTRSELPVIGKIKIFK